ncbi:RNA polymerase II transcription factor B subunit 4 [Rhizophlyctis rosea]|nr:RNA polymerase II transcription factor B subunit 4 [Rhizophlyctis rosea]
MAPGEPLPESAAKKPPNVYKHFKDVDDQVVAKLKKLVSEEEGTSSDINRFQKNHESITVQSRVLILSISPDAPSQYIPLMNCIFSAQRMQVRLDVCHFPYIARKTQQKESGSIFLKQASHITGGIYLEPPEPDNLIQYLLYAFLPEPKMRTMLSLPYSEQIDYRSACFCHKRVVDVGFVCSVCLSVFCSVTPECPTCKSKFTPAVDR